MVYPQNSQAMVEGILQFLDVDPHSLIEGTTEPLEFDSKKHHAYPHPTGVTLTELLRHYVDLSAVPSPSVARLLLGRSTLDYKNEIAVPRRTMLDLMADAPRRFALEEILYNLPPIKPLYYSFACAPLQSLFGVLTDPVHQYQGALEIGGVYFLFEEHDGHKRHWP